MHDAVIVSDIHLGSDNCQARSLCRLLERIELGDLATARLILNGDVFDSIDFRRLKKSHWKVLSHVRKLSDRIEVVWICGNHDGPAEIVSHLLGTVVVDEYTLHSGGRRILVLHGHTFDEFIDAHPVLTWLADCVYALLQRLDRSHYFAKLAKHNSKTFLRCVRKVEDKSREHGRRKGCEVVCCGHTHAPTANRHADVAYFNSGCWTEAPGTYLTVKAGHVELHPFEEVEDRIPVPAGVLRLVPPPAAAEM